MVLDFGKTFKNADKIGRQIEQVYRESQEGSGIHFKPAIALNETPKTLVLKATLPGFCRDDLDIKITENAAIVSGVLKDSAVPFRQVVALPEPVDRDRAEVDYSNGILTVVLGKLRIEN
ncbi:Hsp20 family protein [Lyngbya sp. CCY1209]|jgi:HSP20 family protein|uniref:Hsp20/alpha crystallin family protein n=1 Tax=Lyngbya sp. CCY1209 TaxID=2886103 RepID=UPI002D210923|nr:Hsp20 family protein [Lyngbya sp. CCY1209]MEB3886076.1 Hsp20 family protein [Lyngbya sp. CCY1209]